MAALCQDTRSNTRGGVPGLVKIPVIGPALFGKYDAPEDSNRRRNILIFITPVIVEEQVAALRKYKGNLLVGEEQPEEFTTPSATLSDTYMEPLPVDMPGMHAVDEAVKPPASRDRPMVIEPFDSRPARSNEPPPIQQFLDEAPVEEQPIVDEGLTDLRRIRIADVSTTGPNVIVPRGPSGALTGPGAGTGAAAGAAAAAARPQPRPPEPPHHHPPPRPASSVRPGPRRQPRLQHRRPRRHHAPKPSTKAFWITMHPLCSEARTRCVECGGLPPLNPRELAPVTLQIHTGSQSPGAGASSLRTAGAPALHKPRQECCGFVGT